MPQRLAGPRAKSNHFAAEVHLLFYCIFARFWRCLFMCVLRVFYATFAFVREVEQLSEQAFSELWEAQPCPQPCKSLKILAPPWARIFKDGAGMGQGWGLGNFLCTCAMIDGWWGLGDGWWAHHYYQFVIFM